MNPTPAEPDEVPRDTYRTIAVLLGCSERTVHRYVKNGTFPHTPVGIRSVRFSRQDRAAIVEIWQNMRTATPKP